MSSSAFFCAIAIVFSANVTATHLIADVFDGLGLSPGNRYRRWERANKCLLIKAWPECDLTACQKSIYLAEQGGRSQPGLKKWVSGWLSPSVLPQLGMRVLHHPTHPVTSAGQQGGKSNGVSCSPTSAFLVARPGVLWFHLTHRLHMNKEGAPWWLLTIEAITAVANMKDNVFLSRLKLQKKRGKKRNIRSMK